MRRKTIGKMYFGGEIDVTDPCYDKDVWCRMGVTVKSGEYNCVVWRHKEPETLYDEHTAQTVGIIGIYLDGYIPAQKQMRQIGGIGVDAGLAGFFINKPDYTNEQWEEFCASINTGYAWIKEDGFFSFSGYGDGWYGVYAYEQNGEIVALEIRFL